MSYKQHWKREMANNFPKRFRISRHWLENYRSLYCVITSCLSSVFTYWCPWDYKVYEGRIFFFSVFSTAIAPTPRTVLRAEKALTGCLLHPSQLHEWVGWGSELAWQWQSWTLVSQLPDFSQIQFWPSWVGKENSSTNCKVNKRSKNTSLQSRMKSAFTARSLVGEWD